MAKSRSMPWASRKASAASSYWKLWRAVTPRRNEGCAAGEKVLETVPFVGEGALPVDTTIGDGLGKRRALDLSTLSRDALLTAQDRFFIRTGRPDRLPPTDSWKVRVHGLVQRPVEVPVEQLKGEAGSGGPPPPACAGNTRGAPFGFLTPPPRTGDPLMRLLG